MDIRSIISKVEALGVDASALHDLQTRAQGNPDLIVRFDSTLTTLDKSTADLFSSKNLLTIDFLLQNLKNGLAEVPSTVTQQLSQSNNNNNQELMDFMRAMKEGLSEEVAKSVSKGLAQARNGQITTQDITKFSKWAEEELQDPPTSKMDTVFVNPIDENKFNNLKGKVSIEEKKSSNISDKLDKLKKLKQDKL